jgi:MFS family permease
VSTPLRRQLGLIRRAGSFRLLFSATLGSGIGNWMATIALTADVNARTNSSWWVSALFFVTFVPPVVVGLIAGPFIDRLSRKRLVVGSDIVRLGVFSGLPFATSTIQIIALAAVAGIANSVFRPAVLAGLPNLVSEQDLGYATSILQATEWAATAFGPAVAGTLISLSSTDIVYWINAGTFAFSAALLLRIPSRLFQSEQAITRGHWRDVAEGLQAFKRPSATFVALFAFGFAMLATGLINISEIFLAKHVLHSGTFGFGLLWSATGIGLVIGSLTSGSLVEHRDITALYPLTFLPWAVGILGAALAPSIWVATISMVVAGFGNGLAFPLTVLIVQRYTADRLRGRAFTVIISAHSAFLGLAIVASGALTGLAGARWTYGLASLLLASAAVTAFVLTRDLVGRPVVATA